MTIQNFITVLFARWKTVVFIFTFITSITIVASLTMEKSYTAKSTIVVDIKSPDPLAGTILPAQLIPSYVSSQVEIIKSERVARTVVRLLKMDQSPIIKEQWLLDTEGQGNLVIWLADKIRKDIQVRPLPDSTVIVINYSSEDPNLSANIANGFANAYLQTNLDLKVKPAKQQARWFDEKMHNARNKLEAAQSKLSSFQQKNGIVADDRLDIEIAKLAELNSKLISIQSTRVDSSSRNSQSTKEPSTMSEVLQNPLLVNLQSELTKQEANLQTLKSRLGKSHPELIDAQVQVNIAEKRLSIETKRVINSIGSENKVDLQREINITRDVTTQKENVLALKNQRDKISVLKRDVESAQRAYDVISERLTQLTLESQTQHTNVSILTPASPPIKHSSPILLLNIVVGIFLGLASGIALALILEFLDHRIRSEDDLTEITNLPILGVVS